MQRFVPVLLSLCLASSAEGLPLLSEVFYDASGSDNGGVFVELYGLAGTSLDGMVLEGVNGSNGAVGPTVALSGVIPADGVFVVADDSGDGTTLVLDADLIVNFDFQNGPDSVLLRLGSSLLDALGYGVFGAGDVFAGEGTPAPDAPSGSSLARHFANVDSDDNASDFAVATPTPGSAPIASVPAPPPAPLVLSGFGLWGLRALGRRRRSAIGR